MPDWDADSPKLRENLANLLREIARSNSRREAPTIEAARDWHRSIMASLDVPNQRWVGRFRGEPGLEQVQVRVGAANGVYSAFVAEELKAFETKLQAVVGELDALIPDRGELDSDQLPAVIDLCAWAHAE